VTALVLLVVTAAAAVLLAVRYHLAWPPVVVAIVGTLPALYLAWAALAGAVGAPEPAAEKPVYGRPALEWDPADLGVHRVIGGGRMPAYVARPHDELLQAVLDPAARASRLVVVRGGSSTGKTRAAYEAVIARLADWRLDYPLDPGALVARLEAGIPDRTVLWLGELRQYADADGGMMVLARLADLLGGEGCLAITTIWPEQWGAYTAAARAGPGAGDPAGTAGRLLERLPELSGRDPAAINPARGGIIDVSAEFTAADLEAAARTGDRVLAEAAAAAAAAGQDGQITQYMAGVPDLLDRYSRPGGDPYGQAVITASMDAARLGHTSLLPAALLQDAAIGYLTGAQRTKDIAIWRDTALSWAAEELKGAVRALEPVPPPGSTGVAGYRVADYLDQYGRRTRQDQLGPPSLWDALATWTTGPIDLDQLGKAARDRGLYRHAAILWTKGASRGRASAASRLVHLLTRIDPHQARAASRWVVGQVSLDDLWGVADLLKALREAGAGDAVATLAARAADQASLDNSWTVVVLLGALQEAGAGDAVSSLLARGPADQVSLDDSGGAAVLLGALQKAGAGDAVSSLLARGPADQASLDDPWGAVMLLGALQEAGASDAVATLAARAAEQISLEDPRDVAALLGQLRDAGAGDAVDTLLARSPADQVSLDDPEDVAWLLRELEDAGAGHAVDTLLARSPADQVSLDDPEDVAWLLRELEDAGAGDAVDTLLACGFADLASLENPRDVARLLRALKEAGAGDAVSTLLARSAADLASLDDPSGVAALLRALSGAGADDAVSTLAGRAAGQASLDEPWGVKALLKALRETEAGDAVSTLAARAANATMFETFLEFRLEKDQEFNFGREPNGYSSEPWNWQGPIAQ
jgi:uncharacterized protein YidB (DUF937 family)